jgi:hypothetical protein
MGAIPEVLISGVPPIGFDSLGDHGRVGEESLDRLFGDVAVFDVEAGGLEPLLIDPQWVDDPAGERRLVIAHLDQFVFGEGKVYESLVDLAIEVASCPATPGVSLDEDLAAGGRNLADLPQTVYDATAFVADVVEDVVDDYDVVGAEKFDTVPVLGESQRVGQAVPLPLGFDVIADHLLWFLLQGLDRQVPFAATEVKHGQFLKVCVHEEVEDALGTVEFVFVGVVPTDKLGVNGFGPGVRRQKCFGLVELGHGRVDQLLRYGLLRCLRDELYLFGCRLDGRSRAIRLGLQEGDHFLQQSCHAFHFFGYLIKRLLHLSSFALIELNMEITTLINAHGLPELVADTVESVACYLGPNVQVVLDGGNHDAFKGVQFPYFVGLTHMHHKAPYRNMLFGMKKVVEANPHSDWYVYMDYDCLVLSDAVARDMATWAEAGVWVAGGDKRVDQRCDLGFAESVLRLGIDKKEYLLGAFLAFHKDFIARLLAIDFWERMLFKTSDFQRGFFPGYKDWDVSEHLYPSLAASLGGTVLGLSKFDQRFRVWEGNFQRYPIRWQPEIAVEEILPPASVAHPVKEVASPIRALARSRRRRERGTSWAA